MKDKKDRVIIPISKERANKAIWLLQNKVFQADILLIRKEFGVPKEGFNVTELIYENNQEVLAWRRKMDSTYLSQYWGTNKPIEEIPHNKLKNMIADIVVKFSLSPAWTGRIKKYVLTNNDLSFISNPGVKLVQRVDKATKLVETSFIKDDFATNKELNLTLSILEKNAELSFSKKGKRNPVFYTRNKYCFEKSLQNLKHKQIANSYAIDFPGKSIDEENVAEYIRAYKKYGLN